MARTKCCCGSRNLQSRYRQLREPCISSIRKDILRPRRVRPKFSSTPTSTQDEGFPFTKLPLELRLKIWEMTTEEPRIVILRTSKDGAGFNSPSSIAAALHVCSESRGIALKTYKLCFGCRTDGFKPMIFFNFDQDTLYFRGDGSGGPNLQHSHIGVFGSGIKEDERDRIQSLAVDINTGSPATAFRNVNFQQWNGLRDLRLCIEEPRLDLGSNLAFRDLKDREHWAFVRDYRRAANYWLVDRSLRPSAAIEKIEEKHMDSYPHLKKILKAAGGGGFSLAVVVGQGA